jgi:sugar phosphate isomerase/epimerase
MRASKIGLPLACLTAAMRAKSGDITRREIDQLAEMAEHAGDLRVKAAVDAFRNRLAFAGAELHDFLLEDGERMAAE